MRWRWCGSRRRNHFPRSPAYRFLLSDIHPIYVCEIMEDRTLVEWLRRAPRDPQFSAAFNVACAALRSDSRVQELLAFSGEKPKGTAFVGEAIERLERKLGIYSR